MAVLQMLYGFLMSDINMLVYSIGATKPGFNTQEIGTGFGPNPQVIKMRELN